MIKYPPPLFTFLYVLCPSVRQQIPEIVRVEKVRHPLAVVQTPEVVVVVQRRREADEGSVGVRGEGRRRELVLCDLQKAGRQAQETFDV